VLGPRSAELRLILLSALVLLEACATAPPPLPDLPSTADVSGVHAFLRSHGAEDARFQSVTERPFLKVDYRLRKYGGTYPEAQDMARRREFIIDFLREAAATGERSLQLAVHWIGPAELARFNAAHGISGGGDPYAALLHAYDDDLAGRLQREIATVDAIDSEAGLDAYWTALNDDLEESIMTRGRSERILLNAPAVPFIDGWIAYHNWHDYRGPLSADFADSVVYSPQLDSKPPPTIDPADWALLQRFAPVIVQERIATPDYPDTFDHFGAVSLTGADLASALPTVDPGQAAVYAFIERKKIQGLPVRQLVYTIWYPQHPAMSTFDPEAGALDGWTIRISLDDEGHAQVAESVSNCGCYYKIFPGTALEAASNAAYPEKVAGKSFYLERHLEHDFDAVVPETITDLDRATHGVTVYMSAGYHHLMTIHAEPLPPEDTGQSYRLMPYDDLEQLPFKDHSASLFATDGLVRQAHRRECTLLTPSGVYHAGHPRQRETQMIYFDEADFDDPELLEHYLRLPPAAMAPGA